MFGYPVPFTGVTTGGLGIAALFLPLLYFEARENRSNLIVPLVSTALSFSTLTIHEVIGVLYENQAGRPMAQSAVAMLLPIVKFGLRFGQVYLLKDFKAGLATSIITFEVEFFNSLYTSVFLQTTTSPLTMCALMFVDFTENTMFVVRLRKEAHLLKKRGTTKNQQLARLLFKTEMVVLIEFIEFLTPIL